MTQELTVVGGVYQETCIAPDWDQVFGSGGRAAVAASSHVDRVKLYSLADSETEAHFATTCRVFGIDWNVQTIPETLRFDYIHCLSSPRIRPKPPAARTRIELEGDVVLRFGMLDGDPLVRARRCVYDPQSAFSPELFAANGSSAERLAVVGNEFEIRALGDEQDVEVAAQRLVQSGAEVVVVKRGPNGASVVDGRGNRGVPAYFSQQVWTVGSGDVFAAIFAAHWGVHGIDAAEAADLASRAVADYASTRALPSPVEHGLRTSSVEPVSLQAGQIYLAAPFFDLARRWMVEETLKGLRKVGFHVFSPFHEIGPGPAEMVAPEDLKGVDESDVLFALLDGLDPGTIFEVGYAVARGKHVYAVAENVPEEDLKMMQGSGCRIYSDLVTAIFHAAWRI